MADTKISALGAVTSLVSTDEFPLAHSGTTKKITAVNLAASLGATVGGWSAAGETWTYGSADDPTYTFTITGDLTGVYSPGMRVRVLQSTGGTKYFIVTKVAESGGTTTVTVYGGTDYDLANEEISSPYYSTHKAPFGFPLDPSKWTHAVADTTNAAQASPTSGTWYNLASITLAIPIGVWEVIVQVQLEATRTSGSTPMQVTLSTANNTESDNDFTRQSYANAVAAVGGSHMMRKILSLSAKTSYYLNAKANTTSLTSINFRGDLTDTTVSAVCAYL